MPSNTRNIASPRAGARNRPLALVLLALALVFAVHGAAWSQAQPSTEYKPEVGQGGKDVVWVPTPQPLVEQMLDLAKLRPGEQLIDLGSGDGRLVITAAKRGARAKGIEYNPDMVELSKHNAEKEGVADRATFEKADIFESDFSDAQVITMFLLDSINLKLRPKILELKPGTRIVSNTFRMEDWVPDRSVRIDHCTSWCTAHLWIVPAKVGGAWKLGKRELVIEQQFQQLQGRIIDGKVFTPIKGKVDGDRLTFTGGGRTYSGRVVGDTIEGRVAGAPGARFKAVRPTAAKS